MSVSAMSVRAYSSVPRMRDHVRQGMQNFSNKQLFKCEQTDLGLSTI